MQTRIAMPFSQINATALNRLRRELRDKRKWHIREISGRNRRVRRSWRDISKDYPGINHATLRAIFEDGRDPKDNETRIALSLPTYRLVIETPKHRRIRHSDKPIAQMPVAVLHWKLINREVMK